MSEKSFFFSAVSGAPAYSADDMVQWMYDRFFRGEGVLKGLDNSLAVTADGAGNAVIATGAAAKSGHGYNNTASLSKALTLPSSGYTNINTVVVRVDTSPSPNTMHVYLLVGTSVLNGGTPVAPSIDSTHDVYLADVKVVNTAGTYTYTVTDQRVYCAILPNGLVGANWEAALKSAGPNGATWLTALAATLGANWTAALTSAGPNGSNWLTAFATALGANWAAALASAGPNGSAWLTALAAALGTNWSTALGATLNQSNLVAQQHGQQVFTSSGTWVCPTGVTSLLISGAASGGSGGAATTYGGGGGGSGGMSLFKKSYTPTPGATYTITIGGTGANTTVSGTGISITLVHGNNGTASASGVPGVGGASAGSGSGKGGNSGGGGAGGGGSFGVGGSTNGWGGGGGGSYGSGGGPWAAGIFGGGGGGGGDATSILGPGGSGGPAIIIFEW